MKADVAATLMPTSPCLSGPALSPHYSHAYGPHTQDAAKSRSPTPPTSADGSAGTSTRDGNSPRRVFCTGPCSVSQLCDRYDKRTIPTTEEWLASIGRPHRFFAPVGRNPGALGSRTPTHVDLVGAGLIGYVGNPSPGGGDGGAVAGVGGASRQCWGDSNICYRPGESVASDGCDSKRAEINSESRSSCGT